MVWEYNLLSMSTKTFIGIVVIAAIIIIAVIFGRSAKNDPLVDPYQPNTTTSEPQTVVPTADAILTDPNPSSLSKPMNYTTATFQTSLGNFTIALDNTNTPNTVANFTKLASSGFYTDTKFHRVIKGFMIQGGDPLSKDDSKMNLWGTGGPGYKFADEIKPTNKNSKGTISMANSGPNTNGSQFFINVADNNFLDPKHTVFGRVTSGYDVVEKISVTKTLPGDRPEVAVVIKSIELK